MKAATQIIFTVKIMALLLIFTADSLHAAVDWPWQQAAEQKVKSSAVSASPSSDQSFLAESKDKSLDDVQQIKQKTESIKAELSRTVMPASIPKPIETSMASEAVSKAKGTSNVQNSFTITSLHRHATYEETVKIQAKLTDLLRVTTEIDRANRAQVTVVQSMVDKAMVNQKILTRLASPTDAVEKIKKSDAQQILMSKKIRGMRQEAEKQIILAKSHKESVLPDVRKKP